MSDLDEQQLARLIAALPPAPEAWVTAAQQLPAAREAIETLTARAQASAEQRELILSDLEGALQQHGIDPQRPVLRELKARLDTHE